MMFHNLPPADPDPGGALALDNFPNRMNGGISAQFSHSTYPLQNICHQKGYSVNPVPCQGSLFDSYLDNIQGEIQSLILEYLKNCLNFSLWKEDGIIKVIKYLDGKLLEEASSMESYMDLSTLIPRLDKLMSSNEGGSSAPSVPSLSAGLIGLGAGTPLPEACTTPLSTRNTISFPGCIGVGNLSSVKGSCLKDAKGINGLLFSHNLPSFNGNSTNGHLQWLPNASYYGQQHNSSENLMFWNNTTSNTVLRSYPGQSTLSDKDAMMGSACQMGSSIDLEHLSYAHNFNNMMPDRSFERRNQNRHMSCEPMAEDLLNFNEKTSSALESCGPSMVLDSFGTYGNLKPQSLSTLPTKDHAGFQEKNPTTHQGFLQFGQPKSLAGKCFVGSDKIGMDKVHRIEKQPLNEVEVICKSPQGELQFTSTQYVVGQSQLKSPFRQPSKSSENSVDICASSHNSHRFGSVERLHEHHDQRARSHLPGFSTISSSLDYEEIPWKRMKLDHQWTSRLPHCESSPVLCVTNPDRITSPVSQEINEDGDILVSSKEIPELGVKHYSSSSQGSSGTFSDVKSEVSGVSNKLNLDAVYAVSAGKCSQLREADIQVQIKDDEAKVSLMHNETKEVKKPKLKGVSLIEWFTASQVREHLKSSRHSEGTLNSEKCRNLQCVSDENICQICGLSNLSFDPPTIYCSACLNRIGRSRAYFVASSEALASVGQNYFCNTCYKGSHGGTIQYGKFSVSKSMLEKKKNDDRIPEPWVQCDKCSSWQHQICTLFNDKRNEEEKAEYICPNCYLEEMDNGERHPLSRNTLQAAKGLPKSKLSDHIEKRLLSRLRVEQEDRAKMLGKTLDEVPEVKDLVVRVVSSIDRILEVQKSFSEIFEERAYPKEFSYKSKVILLFQNIEGADVCLFGMYVQEYGSNCAAPNQRHIYLSYIDSVKYFQPDIKSVSGEALRTLVYHEILLGYLDYSKRRGFASCYIWVCPATKREDFIFNCHPEKQKMPKKDKLREWYFAMVEKAAKEDIVVHKTNLYDQFFVSANECKAIITAARLPYFDGDYWPGIAEKVLDNLREQEEGKEPQKKGKIGISRRALKAVRHGTSVQKSKDILLMNKLEELILPKKEDFIMLQLQHVCSHCCQLIISGKRWVCSLCKKFQLCEKCHNMEEELDVKDKHPINSAEKHSFFSVDVSDIPEDTTDEDENVQSEIFDSRIAFLGLCQGEHYQYDSLRHAKYATMMILYHIHSSVPPAFTVSCGNCHCEMKTGQGWHCGVCSEYDLCNTCYLEEGRHHDHRSICPTTIAVIEEQNGSSQQRQASLVKNLLNILEHASTCSSRGCSYPFCRQLKIFFHHCVECRTHLRGGCTHCKKIWTLLKLHARACTETSCQIPRCLDLRNHFRRLKRELQQDSCQRAGALQYLTGNGDLVSEKSM